MRNVSGLKTKYVSVKEMLGTVATWTESISSDRLVLTADATDEVGLLTIPLAIPLLNDDTVGQKYSGEAKIEKVELEYNVGIAALDAEVTAEIHSQSKAVDGVAPVVADVACTVAAGGTITATLDQDDHLITITPDVSVTLDGEKVLNMEVAFDKGATTTVAIYGARIYYKDHVA